MQPQYQALITQLTQLRFTAGPNIDEEGGTVAVVYSSTQNPRVSVTVRTMNLTKEGVGSCTYYDFQVVRN